MRSGRKGAGAAATKRRPPGLGKGLTGAVLAGGESRRMGRDKATLRVDGEPLWRRQVRVLVEAGAAPVVIVRRPGQSRLGRTLRHVRDRVTGAGPLAGLAAALAATEAGWVAVLAVDMPAIDAAWFRWLWTKCRRECGAVVRHAAGFEPLAAIYPRAVLAEVEARLAREERSMQGLVKALVRRRRMRSVRLPAAERGRVANWNAPEDCAVR